MSNKIVLVNAVLHPEAAQRLEEAPNVDAVRPNSTQEMASLLPDAHGIVLGGYAMGAEQMDQAVRLEVIGRHGAGIDNVDLAAASERGIVVTSTPDGPTESTAEHTLMLILAAACRLHQFDKAMRCGDFSVQGCPDNMGCELRGKRLGIVGFGRIGRRVAEMCRDALQMSVYVYDPYMAREDIEAWGATPVTDLIDLAREADVLSAHMPLTTETYHIISVDVIRAMKPSAILINAARGPVLDELALIEALQDGHLGAVGLDVFDPEPPRSDNPLFDIDRVVLTPHTGSFTYEGRRLMGMTVVDDVVAVLNGERPRFAANPEIWARRRVTG
ncbi:MAG: hydroxyacid dehydrogenase [Chloroflexi bacterium]|nr:hydroxyacid dehydrogenase [Chloroflexota bacterium]